MNEPNLAALRQQWLDLQALHSQGALDAPGYETARQALERRIVAAVLATQASSTPPAPAEPSAPPALPSAAEPETSAALPTASIQGVPAALTAPAAPVARVPVGLWAVAAAFIFVLAGAVYAWKGNPRAPGTPPAGFDMQAAAPDAAASAPGRPSGEQLDALVQRLVERLKGQPDDAEGWSLLGRSLMALGRYGDAVGAYAKAAALRPTDPGPLADQADALGVVNGRTLEGEPARLIERALKLDPRHIKSLVLAGTMAFQRNDFATAERHWQAAVDAGPAGDGLVELAREGISQARARAVAAGGTAPSGLANPGGAPATTAPAIVPAKPNAAAAPAAPTSAASAHAAGAAVAGRGISGTVSLAAALKDKAAPGDTVFIFARAAGGGGMPLAILQKRVSDLPATFTLDDSMAMSPAARLSGAERVVVTARVSKSGQAMPQPGDLEGTSAPVAPGALGLAIEISNVRR